MVKEMFRDELTDDVKVWLDCIENGSNDSVQHSDSIFGEFYIMYHVMIVLEDRDAVKFERLLTRLEVCNDWDTYEFFYCVLRDNSRYQQL